SVCLLDVGETAPSPALDAAVHPLIDADKHLPTGCVAEGRDRFGELRRPDIDSLEVVEMVLLGCEDRCCLVGGDLNLQSHQKILDERGEATCSANALTNMIYKLTGSALFIMGSNDLTLTAACRVFQRAGRPLPSGFG